MDRFPVYGPDEVRDLLDYENCIAAVRDAMARFTAEGTPRDARERNRLELCGTGGN